MIQLNEKIIALLLEEMDNVILKWKELLQFFFLLDEKDRGILFVIIIFL